MHLFSPRRAFFTTSFVRFRLFSYKFKLLTLDLQSVLSYSMSPRTCHRFVGYLEEEAVVTYTHAIEELERGHLPIWYARLHHAL